MFYSSLEQDNQIALNLDVSPGRGATKSSFGPDCERSDSLPSPLSGRSEISVQRSVRNKKANMEPDRPHVQIASERVVPMTNSDMTKTKLCSGSTEKNERLSEQSLHIDRHSNMLPLCSFLKPDGPVEPDYSNFNSLPKVYLNGATEVHPTEDTAKVVSTISMPSVDTFGNTTGPRFSKTTSLATSNTDASRQIYCSLMPSACEDLIVTSTKPQNMDVLANQSDSERTLTYLGDSAFTEYSSLNLMRANNLTENGLTGEGEHRSKLSFDSLAALSELTNFSTAALAADYSITGLLGLSMATTNCFRPSVMHSTHTNAATGEMNFEYGGTQNSLQLDHLARQFYPIPNKDSSEFSPNGHSTLVQTSSQSQLRHEQTPTGPDSAALGLPPLRQQRLFVNSDSLHDVYYSGPLVSTCQKTEEAGDMETDGRMSVIRSLATSTSTTSTPSVTAESMSPRKSLDSDLADKNVREKARSPKRKYTEQSTDRRIGGLSRNGIQDKGKIFLLSLRMRARLTNVV